MTRAESSRIVVELLGAFWLCVAVLFFKSCDGAPVPVAVAAPLAAAPAASAVACLR